MGTLSDVSPKKVAPAQNACVFVFIGAAFLLAHRQVLQVTLSGFVGIDPHIQRDLLEAGLLQDMRQLALPLNIDNGIRYLL